MAGELDVDALLRRITGAQFREWQAYYELEPFGEVRADLRAASITQMLYNVNRGKNQRALPLKDFLLKFEADEHEPKQTWQTQWAVVKALAKAHTTDEQWAKLEAIPPPANVTGLVRWPSVIEESIH